MQIHVIRPGETLTSIAQAYGISAQEIAAANQVPDRNRLVVGQTLVITTTGQYHWVQPDESLWTISQRYKISIEEIVRINKIQNHNNLPVGLRLYLPQKPKPTVETNAYIDPRMTRTIGLRGFFYWVLGNDFPQNWLLIEDNFVVRKLL